MIVNTRWLFGATSTVPSPTWEAYAERYSALLTALAETLPGEVTWWDDIPDVDVPLDPGDTHRLARMLGDRRLRNDLGELMEGAESFQWLTGRRTTTDGEHDLVLHGGWGGDKDLKVTASLDVFEPGHLVWSYPDQTIAALFAAVLEAIDGSRARIRDRLLHRLMVKRYKPAWEVGSHVYMPAPLDDPGKFPPDARQVPCGQGFLLIVPPGPTDDDTLARMHWVAAAIGAAD